MDTFVSEDTKKWAMQNVMKLLVEYNRTCIKLRIKYRTTRKLNPTFDLLCTFVDNVIAAMVACFVYLTSEKIELNEPAWVSYCQYIPAANGMRAITGDEYLRFFDTQKWSSDLATVLDPQQPYRDMFCKNYLSLQKKREWGCPCKSNLLIGKLCPTATMVRIVNHIDPQKWELKMEPSSVRFLEVEYKCGNREPLTIEIPKSHYFAENEILSKTYVLRYLEHLPIYVRWKFDESEYSLRIIDEDSVVFSLNSDQYVLLEQDGYKIREN